MKKLCICLMVLMAALMFFGCDTEVPVNTDVRVTKVSLNKDTLSLGVGQTETLVATVEPSEASDKRVTWESDNEEIATVDADGKVTAVAVGETSIIVTTVSGNKIASCTVTVTYVVRVASVSIVN